MAHVEVVLPIKKGDIFKSYEEAEQKITENAKANFVQFYKRESRTISGGAKKTKRYLNPELKFYQVEWACVHGGRNYKCRGNGVRKSRTLKNEDPCPAHIRMKVSPKGDDFVIATVNNKHNHIVSKSLFDRLPQQRKLLQEVKEEAVVHVNKFSLRDKMERKYNKKKNLDNIRRESKGPEKIANKVLSQQAKYRLLFTKSQKAASLGAEACGENFNKVASFFDDIITMLQNNIYEFEFTYDAKLQQCDSNVGAESNDFVNNANDNIDDSVDDDTIEYNIYHEANDDTVDNIHVYSNINVINTETVETETLNHINKDAIINDNKDSNATDDTEYPETNISDNEGVEYDNVDQIPKCDMTVDNIITNLNINANRQSSNINVKTKTKSNVDDSPVSSSIVKVRPKRHDANVIEMPKKKVIVRLFFNEKRKLVLSKYP